MKPLFMILARDDRHDPETRGKDLRIRATAQVFWDESMNALRLDMEASAERPTVGAWASAFTKPTSVFGESMAKLRAVAEEEMPQKIALVTAMVNRAAGVTDAD